MNNNNENAILDAMAFEDEDLDLNSLETELQSELEEQFSDLNLLQEEREHINNPDHLGETVMNVIWEQFMNQVAVTAGEDFIKENRGLKLDLRDEAHIQTTENFAAGKIAGHNTKIDYQERYDDWQSNFVKDEQGNVVTHTTRSGKEEATLVKGARKPFDAERPSGSVERHTDMDHTISAAEIIRDPAANAHMTKEEQIAFANSKANLNEMDSSLNRSKGDKSMADWLDHENSKGQKPDEIFDISEQDKKKLRQKDAEAREEYGKQKKEAEERSIEAGKQSQKEEFFRIRDKALRTALMSLLTTLLKEVIGKLILWLKSAEKSLNTLIDYIKRAIISFASKLKDLLINTTDSILTTIATSIIGPVVGVIKKTVTLLKQGWKSLMEAVQYLRSPENRNKPLRYLLPQVGTIVISGLSGVGAIVLGEFIEQSLMGFPFLAVDIPILGSPANLIGTLMGAIVCGVIGAIAIDLINKYIAKQQENNNTRDQINKKNEILRTQDKLIDIKAQKMVTAKEQAFHTMRERREQAKDTILEAMATIFSEDENEDESHVEYEASKKANYDDRLSKVASELASLLE